MRFALELAPRQDASAAPLPPHLYGQLARTPAGLARLAAKGRLRELAKGALTI